MLSRQQTLVEVKQLEQMLPSCKKAVEVRADHMKLMAEEHREDCLVLKAEEHMAEPMKLMAGVHKEEHMKLRAEEHWVEYMKLRIDFLPPLGVLHPCFPSFSVQPEKIPLIMFHQ